MLNYEEFKKAVIEQIKDYLPEEFEDTEVVVNVVPKVNEMREALNILVNNDDPDAFKATPNVYLEMIYSDYEESGSLDIALKTAAAIIISGYKHIQNCMLSGILSIESKKDQIIMVLINTEKNKELLKEVPHETFLDLSVIYRIIVQTEEDGITSAIIRNDMLDTLKLNESELLDLAMENSKRLLEPKVENLSEVVGELIKSRITSEDQSKHAEEIIEESPLYVLTNHMGLNGAAVVAYGNELSKLADKIKDDLYILPSSIHEVLAISSKYAKLDELREMVRDINATQVAPNEILSDEVYIYERNTGHLRIA